MVERQHVEQRAVLHVEDDEQRDDERGNLPDYEDLVIRD